LTSDLALEDPEIGNTDPNIPIYYNCTDDEVYFGMLWGCEEYDDERDEIDKSDAIANAPIVTTDRN